MTITAADPNSTRNVVALEITRMQIKQAQILQQEMGPSSKDMLPSILLALALNTHARATAPK